MPQWNLFERRPLKLAHPAGRIFMVAVVSPVKDGLVWWNFDAIIAEAIPDGIPGSGFSENPIIPCKYEFHKESNEWWAVSEWVYKFGLPEPTMLQAWDRYKHYIPSLATLTSKAQKTYGEPE